MKVVQRKLNCMKFPSSTEVLRLEHFVTFNQKLQEDEHLKLFAENESYFWNESLVNTAA